MISLIGDKGRVGVIAGSNTSGALESHLVFLCATRLGARLRRSLLLDELLDEELSAERSLLEGLISFMRWRSSS